ncbi:LacI family DNA-binding transcriptional regulator [Myceligenerans indicum]|uniref:LacI family transcriptional regulator n=1 Tax=Myceligenerans indicum TaxID=2593663 RepID=A0ABS1LI18_9MICO|nr:LacI family DNA-binding transcriptional regulator [Myceligenerans indicum]MBL0885227.1 LacI family transcriptional regulator [Myceligenerans indicum]
MARSARVTIVDVARAAGTSVSSASVALRGESGVSEETRRRIVRIAEDLGYRPNERARKLREQHPRLLGVTFTVAQAFHADVVDRLYRAVAGSGYGLVLSAVTGTRRELEAAESLLQDRCAALILISPEIGDADLAALGHRAHTVTIGSELHASVVDSVHADDRHGIRLAVDHLVRTGHRDIQYVAGGRAVAAETRRVAYLESMAAHGLSDRARVLDGEADEESGSAAAAKLLAEGALPTAVLTHNDMTAFGLLVTLRTQGVRVPDDVSVVGYDDSRIASLRNVELTSVSQDPDTLAATAVRRAIAHAEGEAATMRQFVTPPRLVVRTSSGPARTGSGQRRSGT